LRLVAFGRWLRLARALISLGFLQQLRDVVLVTALAVS
jgi:hypothetical protein